MTYIEQALKDFQVLVKQRQKPRKDLRRLLEAKPEEKVVFKDFFSFSQYGFDVYANALKDAVNACPDVQASSLRRGSRSLRLREGQNSIYLKRYLLSRGGELTIQGDPNFVNYIRAHYTGNRQRVSLLRI